MQILSVNVGQLREITIKNREVQTGIYKFPVTTPVMVDRLGLKEDIHIETRKMGMEHSAVYAYPYEHYAYWQNELGREEPFPMGQFGENLTVTGLLEEEVRIGDIFRVGNTVLQVAHPRIPCNKLNERMGLRFAATFLASCKVGYYCRVLQEGTVTQGDSIELLERDEHSPTMDEFVRIAHYEYWDAEALQYLLGARDLLDGWREILELKLSQAQNAEGWHGLRKLNVVRREQESEDTVSLYLQCAKDKPLTAFRGGQLLMVVLRTLGSIQQRQPYYLSSDPQDPSSYRITVQNIASTTPAGQEESVSAQIYNLQPGDHVLCNTPHGPVRSMPEEALEQRMPVLVSQGLGIAPVLSLLYELEEIGIAKVVLFHEPVAQEPQGLIHELNQLIERNPGYQLIYPDRATKHVTAALLHQHVPLAHCNIEVAGPREFIARLEIELMAFNISPAALITYKID